MDSILKRLLVNCSNQELQVASCADQHEEYHPSQRPTLLLQNHQPDSPMRCVIDPSDVQSAIQHQGKEALRQQEAQQKQQQQDKSRQGTIVTTVSEDSSVLDTESSWPSSILAAKTDVTTNTNATPIVTNLDQYVKKNHKNKLDQFKMLEGIDEEEDAKKTAFFAQFAGKENSKTRNHKSSKHSKNSPTKSSSSNSSKNNNQDSSSSSSWLGNVLPDPWSMAHEMARKTHFTKALHLKVRANMGKFFWLQYIKTFPQSPIPDFVAYLNAEKGKVQQVTRAWTDATAYMPMVHYGSPVHSEPITMMVDNSDFLDLGVTGSLGLVKRFEVSETGQRLKSPNHYKVLLNRRSGVPLAVCALKSPHGSPVVRIFTVKQHAPRQKRAATTDQIGIQWCPPYPLYAWAEFVAEGDYPNPVRYSLFLSTNDGKFEKKPSYRAFHRTIGSPELLVMGKTEHESQKTGAACISFQFSEEEDYFAVSVARGIDPALMICLAGIVDETMEASMRRKCDAVRQCSGDAIPNTPDRIGMERAAMAEFAERAVTLQQEYAYQEGMPAVTPPGKPPQQVPYS